MKKVAKTIFTCDKCGKEIEYTTKNEYDDNFDFAANECWEIRLGQPGYGSKLDGCYVDFDLCDDCLYEFINTFKVEGKERVFNSGSNRYLSSEDWIRVEKGEMPDEEMEENGMYSPRQIKAYKEKFPQCDKVKRILYKDGSIGSRCPYGAFGDENGNYGLNTAEECFSCEHFKERESDVIPLIKHGDDVIYS